jgi:transposase
MVWCFVRCFLPTPSGRKRFNVLGAVDALSKEIITVVNETTVTAETMCQLLSKLAAHVREGAITVVLDNARYQKCAMVQEYAGSVGIELLYLPSFSPQLNLIERLWRYVRKECLYSHYYATFPEFRAALESWLAKAHKMHRLELETLLAWNFQSFRDVNTLPA